MKTIIDRINDTMGLEQRMAAARDSRVNVITTGLFGIYHYKVGKYEFQQKKIGSRQFSPCYWYMTVNGKTIRIHYKYVFHLTMKTLGFIK